MAFHSFETAKQISAKRKDFYGLLMECSCKQNEFSQNVRDFWGNCPIVQVSAGLPFKGENIEFLGPFFSMIL